MVWGGRGESVAHQDGERLKLSPLLALSGEDPNALWAQWGDRVASAAEGSGRPPRIPAKPPTGWNDWYVYYGTVTAEDVRRNLAEAAAGEQAGLEPLEVIQIDDGWEKEWGDWTPNQGFPDGLAPVVADIVASGRRAGLWMAPFYVSTKALIYAEHPEWWVRDTSGAVLLHGNLAVVDVTVPEAAAWMQDRVREQVASGFQYLKLDFLYAGAVEGRRSEPVTGMAAYQKGLDLLREAAGENTEILACGAPMLPTVGFAEYWRSGSDIAFELSPDPQPAFLRWQARSTAARAWANGRWWWNDPDPILMRSPFDDLQARGAIAASVASGGLWFLGDELSELPPERRALALTPGLVSLRGVTAIPQDPLDFPSGFDASPLIEAGQDDDQVPVEWTVGESTVWMNLNLEAVTVDTLGTDLLGGRGPGPTLLAPGDGGVWQ